MLKLPKLKKDILKAEANYSVVNVGFENANKLEEKILKTVKSKAHRQYIKFTEITKP